MIILPLCFEGRAVSQRDRRRCSCGQDAHRSHRSGARACLLCEKFTSRSFKQLWHFCFPKVSVCRVVALRVTTRVCLQYGRSRRDGGSSVAMTCLDQPDCQKLKLRCLRIAFIGFNTEPDVRADVQKWFWASSCYIDKSGMSLWCHMLL